MQTRRMMKGNFSRKSGRSSRGRLALTWASMAATGTGFLMTCDRLMGL